MAGATIARQTGNSATPAPSDLAALKIRQQAAWSSGNYAVVGTTLQIVGEELCETLDLRAGAKVLDVAAGNGMASLAAARRWCRVTSTDYVPALLEAGQARALAEGLSIEFMEADAENLPFASAAFDAVCDVLVERLGATRAVLPGAGHSVQRLGEPFNELLTAFVSAARAAWP